VKAKYPNWDYMKIDGEVERRVSPLHPVHIYADGSGMRRLWIMGRKMTMGMTLKMRVKMKTRMNDQGAGKGKYIPHKGC
jgi:hypothetical protein